MKIHNMKQSYPNNWTSAKILKYHLLINMINISVFLLCLYQVVNKKYTNQKVYLFIYFYFIFMYLFIFPNNIQSVKLRLSKSGWWLIRMWYCYRMRLCITNIIHSFTAIRPYLLLTMLCWPNFQIFFIEEHKLILNKH